MSAKNVRNVSIFHISSCQTACQGKNPNKLNNNFLIKLNYYFRFIFFLFFGRQIAFEHWAFKTSILIGWSANGFYYKPISSENNRKILKLIVPLLRIATKLCAVWAFNDVINMGWMVCMNNVQKFFLIMNLTRSLRSRSWTRYKGLL